MTWVTDRPPRSIDLDTCVTCGLCLPVCPTFRLTGDETASPRGRLAAIAAVDQGTAPLDQRFDDVTAFCLQCRACETACPSLVPYGAIIERARAETVSQRPSPGRRMQRFLLGRLIGNRVALQSASIVAASLQRMRLMRRLPMVGSTSVGLRPIPLPVRTAVGGTWGPPEGEPIVLFAGCVSDVWFSGTHRAVIELLAAAGYRVTAPADQTCCGALAAHAGFDAEAQAMASRNVEALQGEAIIVTDAAGCGAHLQSYDTHDPDGQSVARRVVDATDLVLRAVRDGRLPVLTEEAGTIAVQDPCHLEHGMRVVDAPRELLEAGGYTVIDADRGGLCCGAAGVYQLEFPRASDELGTAKARAVTATGVTAVASANAGCEMQLRRFLGEGYRVAHPVEWYWERWRTQR